MMEFSRGEMLNLQAVAWRAYQRAQLALIDLEYTIGTDPHADSAALQSAKDSLTHAVAEVWSLVTSLRVS